MADTDFGPPGPSPPQRFAGGYGTALFRLEFRSNAGRNPGGERGVAEIDGGIRRP
jgi:hypothetical protein